MATLDDIDFEGTYPPTGWSEGGTVANVDVSTAWANSGTHSLRALSASAAQAYIYKSYTSKRVLVARFYVYFHVLPSVQANFFIFNNANGSVYLRYYATGPVFRLTVGASNYSGPALAVDTLYRIDIRVDSSANPMVVDWQVNGAAQTQRTNAQTAADITELTIGIVSTSTHDVHFDDLKVTDVSGDYPLGSISAVGSASAITASGTGAAYNVTSLAALYDIDFEGSYPPSGWSEQATVANVGTSTLQANSGTTSLRIYNPTATTAYIRQTAQTGRLFVMRFYLRIHAAPSTNVQIVEFVNANGTIAVRLTTARVIRIYMGTTNYDGPVLNVDQWYRVNLRVDTTGASAVVDWQIDSTAQTQAVHTQAAADMTAINIGIITSVTVDVYFDDLKISNVSGDYPFGTAGAVFTSVSALTALGTGSVSSNRAGVMPAPAGASGSGEASHGDSMEAEVASISASGGAAAAIVTGEGIASATGSALGATGTGAAYNATVQRIKHRHEFPHVVQTLSSALRTSHTPLVRVLFMEGDLSSVKHVVPMAVITGSVNMDRQREVARQATVTLANDQRFYSPLDPTSLVWPGRLIRVERGAVVNGVEEYVSLVTGLLSAPAQSYGDSTITFTVWSRLRLLDRQFSAPVTFDAETPLATIVRAICQSGGMGASDAFYDLQDDGRTLAVVRSFDLADNMLHALTQLCFDNGLDGPYDDGDGNILVRPFSDPSENDTAWTFAPGTLSVLTDVSWSLEERSPVLYNRQVVEGVAPDRYPVRGEARDLNPASPTYNPVDGSGPLGDLPAPPYVSADIHTEDVAAAVALQLLYEHALADLPVNANAVPIPTLKPRDVVSFAAGDLNVTARLDSLTIPLGPGQMTLQAQGVRSLVASMGDFELNRLIWDIAKQATAPLETVIVDGTVVTVDGLKASVLLPGNDEATPGFSVLPDLTIAVGDHVLCHRKGGFQVVFAKLSATVEVPIIPPVEPPPVIPPPPTPTSHDFPQMTIWWPYWVWATQLDVSAIADAMLYMQFEGVVLMGMQWGHEYALPTDIDEKLDIFIAKGIKPYLGLWVGKLDDPEQTVSQQAWDAGNGKWAGIVLDAEDQWVQHCKPQDQGGVGEVEARSDFDAFMAIFRPLTDQLAVACYSAPTSFPNYNYEWWNEVVDTFLPLAYYDQPTDTFDKILDSMWRKFNSVSSTWTDALKPLIPVFNGYGTNLDAADAAERVAYVNRSLIDSAAVQMWRWMGDTADPHVFSNPLVREALHGITLP